MALDSTQWLRKTKVTLSSAMVVESVDGLCVVLTKHAFAANAQEIFDADLGTGYHAKNGGGDIRITLDEAGQVELPFDIESFVTNNDPTLGTCEIWVRVPTVSSSATNSIWVWYGNASATAYAVTATYGRNATWVDYEFVCHCGARYLEYPSTGTPAYYPDSTGKYTAFVYGSPGSVSAEVVADAPLPPFGTALKYSGWPGGLKTNVPAWQIAGQDSFFCEAYFGTIGNPDNAILGTVKGVSPTDHGDETHNWMEFSVASYGGATERYLGVGVGGTSTNVTLLTTDPLCVEATTWTWGTIGRWSGVGRLMVGSTLITALVAPTLLTDTNTYAMALGLSGPTNTRLKEWRISKGKPSEARHVVSRNMLRTLGTSLVAAVPQAAPYTASYTVTLKGVMSGSRYRIEKLSDGSLIGEGTSTGADIAITYSWAGDYSARLIVRKGSASPKYLEVVRTLTLAASNQTINVEQIKDTAAL